MPFYMPDFPDTPVIVPQLDPVRFFGLEFFQVFTRTFGTFPAKIHAMLPGAGFKGAGAAMDRELFGTATQALHILGPTTETFGHISQAIGVFVVCDIGGAGRAEQAADRRFVFRRYCFLHGYVLLIIIFFILNIQ
jgi:hypothetical protein